MTSTFYRVSTANMYDSAVRNLQTRQSTLSGLQENMTSGKRVVRASDEVAAVHEARLDLVQKKGGACLWRQ